MLSYPHRHKVRAALLLGLALVFLPLRGLLAQPQDGAQAAAPGLAPARETPTALVGSIDPYAGLNVASVELAGMAGEGAQKRLQSLMVQQPGEPLDRQKIRRTLRALYATGLFSNLQAEVERSAENANAVALVFRASPNYFIGGVRAEGSPKHPAAHQLVNASKLRLGELYTPDKIETALLNMQALLKDNGFYQAAITHAESFHSDTQQVDVIFHLEPGKHARLGRVAVAGEPGYSPAELAHLSGYRAGDAVTAQRVSKALHRIRRKYQKEGRLEAEVSLGDKSYHANDNTLDYVLEAKQGPTVAIRVEGAHVSQARLKKSIPVFEEGAVDDDLLNEGLRNLRDYFQMQGFFAVQVRWERRFDEERRQLEVVYKVDPGIRYKLAAIHIEGNRSFDTELIRERMQIKPASNLLTHGLYSESMLKRDIETIQQTLYKVNGFSHAMIEAHIDREYQGAEGHMLVTLHIEEGSQVRVGKVQLLGNNSFRQPALEARLAAQGAGLSTVAGQPFSEANLAQDREVLMSFYIDNGFPDAQVEALPAPTQEDSGRVDVVFSIHEGAAVRVDRVLLSGLNYTRKDTIRRALQVEAGAPLNQLSMLDTQRSLYDLGLFTQVDMAVQNPEGKAPYKNILFQVREAQRWTFNYGVGFELQTGGEPVDVVNSAPAPGVSLPKGTTVLSSVPLGSPSGGTTFSPSLAFEVTRTNFRGTDNTVSFKTHLGNLQKRALLSYTAPHWLDNNALELSFSALYDDSRDVRTFASQHQQGSVQLEQTLTRRSDGEPITTLLYRYSYRRVAVDAKTLAISTELIPLLSKPVLLGMPSITYIRDRRDDVLDAHRGNYTTVDLGVSARAFGSGAVQGTAEEISGGALAPNATAADFTRLLLQNSTYVPIWRDQRGASGHGIVFARTTHIGVENVFGKGASTALVPLPERFFMGGTNSLRGFALNQAGPRDLDTGFPLGGKASFYNSFEMRFPPPTLPWVGTNMSFVLFHDAGNVFQSGTEMLHSFSRWRQQQRSLCDDVSTYRNCHFDYMSQALGTGIRYKTPIGPVRADVSYNLSPPSFPYFVCPSSASATGCVLPNTTPLASGTPAIFQHSALRHFNFSFSIGQSF